MYSSPGSPANGNCASLLPVRARELVDALTIWPPFKAHDPSLSSKDESERALAEQVGASVTHAVVTGSVGVEASLVAVESVEDVVEVEHVKHPIS